VENLCPLDGSFTINDKKGRGGQEAFAEKTRISVVVRNATEYSEED
jgi:hypothetical protein